MKLEDVTVILRPRQPWEAVDLGCAMVRREFPRLLALWATTVVPVWVLISLLFHESPGWIIWIVWWLKPLYDRVPLYFLSRSTFGVRPGFVEIWKQWPRLWLANFLPALLWRRLSPIRSFALPAQMLEGLRGRAVNRRVSTLASDGGGSGFWLTYGFVKLETLVMLGLAYGTYGWLPEQTQFEFSTMIDAGDFSDGLPKAIYWWAILCQMAATTLLEPFYVGAGFGLYLNCRSRIEGWDVELAFRRMASRLRDAAVACLLAVMFVGGFGANDLHAQDAKKVAEEVLKQPEFEVAKMQSRRWVSDEEEVKDRSKDDKARASAKWDGVPLFNGLFSVLFWTVVGLFVGWLVHYMVKNRHMFSIKAPARAAPKVVMGMNITPESLPDDIVAAARAAWAAGEFKEALGLLYRGALSSLVTRQRVPIEGSDTEEDCLQRVVAAGEPRVATYFRNLTGAWVQVAYAVLPVSDEEMNALCQQWPFRETGGAA